MMNLAMSIAATLVGVVCVSVKREKISNSFRSINQEKGRQVYSETNIASRVRIIKITGWIALVLGLLITVMEIVAGF